MVNATPSASPANKTGTQPEPKMPTGTPPSTKPMTSGPETSGPVKSMSALDNTTSPATDQAKPMTLGADVAKTASMESKASSAAKPNPLNAIKNTFGNNSAQAEKITDPSDSPKSSSEKSNETKKDEKSDLTKELESKVNQGPLANTDLGKPKTDEASNKADAKAKPGTPPPNIPKPPQAEKIDKKDFSKQLKKIRKGGGKGFNWRLAAGAALLLLVTLGGAAGYYLTQLNQDTRQQAAGRGPGYCGQEKEPPCTTGLGIQSCASGLVMEKGLCVPVDKSSGGSSSGSAGPSGAPTSSGAPKSEGSIGGAPTGSGTPTPSSNTNATPVPDEIKDQVVVERTKCLIENDCIVFR